MILLLGAAAIGLAACASSGTDVSGPRSVTGTAVSGEHGVRNGPRAEPASGSLADQQYAFAERLYRDGDPYAAYLEFERYLQFHPDGRQAADARLKGGWCLYTGRRFERSLARFRELSRTLPPGAERALAYAGAGFCHLQLFAPRAARDAFTSASADPGELSGPARLWVGWTYMEEWDWHRAKEELAGLAGSPPMGIDATLVSEVVSAADAAERLPRKLPAVSTALSALCPGAGQMYCGRTSDGVFTMVVTDLFIGLTVLTAVQSGNHTAVAALGTVAGVFYLGNVVGGYNAALIANEREPRAVLDRLRAKVLVPPGSPAP